MIPRKQKDHMAEEKANWELKKVMTLTSSGS
jgi:hypothetical protein